MSRKKRIGIFGGSFDPPHIGHLICARSVAEELELDQILIIPTAVQPGKPNGSVESTEDRWEMVKAMTSGDSLFKPLKIEIERGGTSYTVDTLRVLRQEYPVEDVDLFLLLGFDSANGIEKWREPDAVTDLAQLAVMQRVGDTSDGLPKPWCDKMIVVNTPVIEISSTNIRQRLKHKLPIGMMTGESVLMIIEKNKLYSQ
ncbi:MAG: nicotinate (nicotinamide) nucleotide adenylyltransferase [Calditrichaeota bacterium]|nr:nicotinate (nicotinamide) nucleotide adenylyltransferase [Calditrichota bacterium]MBT7619086.1 nicotinate (nicotinamide) nucleotide adenylyltransferase [Calditrichota bacterium]MBT7789735.1 nicotinate (nicotinamide) nucleotide adenylyltransferase [Calditrichota bacterium]